MFCVDLRTNSYYFLYSINWLEFITQIKYLLLIRLYKYRHFKIQQIYILTPHCIYVLLWVWDQTAIISLYNVNWLVIVT